MLSIILNQMFIMFTLVAVGFGLNRVNLISDEGERQLSTILFKLCTPAIMIQTFNRPFEWTVVRDLALTFILALLSMILAYVVGRILFGPKRNVEWFSIIFSNAGFIGIPLVTAFVGKEAVLYVSAYLLASNVFMWSLGISVLTNNPDNASLKKVLRTPAFTGLALGLIVFLLPWQLPNFLASSVSAIASVNTVLAMLVLGSFVATIPWKMIFSFKALFVSMMRLVAIPLLIIACLNLLPDLNHELRQTLIICTSAPIGVMTAMFSKEYGGDYLYGTSLVSLSTLLSIVTIPFMYYLA